MLFMSYVTIWLHCVWTTKKRLKLIPHEKRPIILEHVRGYAAKNNIMLDYINLHKDHVHSIINLGKTQNIAEILRQLKGECSYWINKHRILNHRFHWQDDYFVVSVSPSSLNSVRSYIKNQDEHHKKMTSAEELAWFLRECGFERFTDSDNGAKAP